MVKTSKSFTLAEVLITLVIIGIIAAITVPIIMANHKKVEYAGKLKKFYSNMTNAIKQAEIQQGQSIQEWDFNNIDEIIKYISYIKVETSTNSCEPWGCEIIYLTDGTIFGYDCSSFAKNNSICVYFDVNGEKAPNKVGRDIFGFSIPSENEKTLCNQQNNFTYDDCLGDAPDDYYKRESIIERCSAGYPGACLHLVMKDGWEFNDDYPVRL